jgi:hypothetical protein
MSIPGPVVGRSDFSVAWRIVDAFVGLIDKNAQPV